ncbi:MAG: outer membrane beta-barrel protein [Cyclobacteriaceae bacterium]|nr:outer membrane beta-barrel protein [Cyclobacteriaceae bacterium]
MKRVLFIWSISLINLSAMGQQNCAQSLRLASSSYDQGRLHELPELLKTCLENGFSSIEKVSAYKLLALSYLYLEEPEKADNAMLNLLRTDNFFEPNQSVDPAEFIGLYNTFRTKPLFSIGIKAIGITTLPSVINNYYVGNAAIGVGEYTTTISIGGGLSFEKSLFQKSKNHLLRKLTIAPDLLFTPRNFSYSTGSIFLADNPQIGNTDPTRLTVVEKQTWIDLNIMLQYKLSANSSWNPYLTIGPTLSFLVGASRENITKLGETGNSVSGKTIDVSSSFRPLIYGANIGLGVKKKLGAVFLTAELRYQHSLGNAINASKRTNLENTFDYASQFNDLNLSAFSIQFGFAYPIFIPKKLGKK